MGIPFDPDLILLARAGAMAISLSTVLIGPDMLTSSDLACRTIRLVGKRRYRHLNKHSDKPRIIGGDGNTSSEFHEAITALRGASFTDKDNRQRIWLSIAAVLTSSGIYDGSMLEAKSVPASVRKLINGGLPHEFLDAKSTDELEIPSRAIDYGLGKHSSKKCPDRIGIFAHTRDEKMWAQKIAGYAQGTAVKPENWLWLDRLQAIAVLTLGAFGENDAQAIGKLIGYAAQHGVVIDATQYSD